MELQVRNAANTIVQAEYGDDGLDPVCMEGKNGEPVALKQKMSIVKALTPKASVVDLTPLPQDFKRIMDEELASLDKRPASNGSQEFCTSAFRASLQGFLEEKVYSRYHT